MSLPGQCSKPAGAGIKPEKLLYSDFPNHPDYLKIFFQLVLRRLAEALDIFSASARTSTGRISRMQRKWPRGHWR
jgi:hypothetical protein